MSRPSARRARALLAIGALAPVAVSCSPDAHRLPDAPTTTAGRLAHTLSIIHGATPAHPGVLRVLFYGQSITSPKWTDLTTAHLRARYPNVRFVVRNLAIGGFSSNLLERTAARDLDEAQPDLIVFHVYGDHRAYERIIRMMRARTAAEIIIQDDHVTAPIEPVCPVGPRLSWTVPPGCTGRFWLHQHDWGERMSAVILPRLADRYGLVLERRRLPWNAYLQQHHLRPGALLIDGTHPNAAGWRLMADLFDGWFDRVVATTPAAPQFLVRDIPPPRPGVTRTVAFEGNRVELVSDGPLAGKVGVLVDGKPPRALDGCWQVSRTTSLPSTPDWPAIKQVTIRPDPLRAETWTATLTDVSPDGQHFDFALASDRGGADGQGHGGEDFTSPSGRVRIAAEDWDLGYAASALHVSQPRSFTVRWTRRFACGDEPAVALSPGHVEQRFLVATGLPAGLHHLTLLIRPGAPPVQAIRVYRPPLPSA